MTTCRWSEDEDGVWFSCDDNAFEFNNGGPIANGFKFCPYCGNLIVICFADEPETIGPGHPDYPETLLMCYLSGQMSEQEWWEINRDEAYASTISRR